MADALQPKDRKPTAGVSDQRSTWTRYLPPLTPRQWRMFGIVSTAGFFESYDRALLSLAIEQIQHGLRIANRQLGLVLSVIRLGYLLALPIASYADRFGRRRLLLYSVIFYTVATAASALAPGVRSFVAFQFVARGFAAAEAAVALVILSEEVDASIRGYSIGLLGALGISGYGLAALVFALIDVMPFGWRGLYALALIPLLVIVPLRRHLPETQRFSRVQDNHETVGFFTPLIELVRNHPRRLVPVLVVTFLYYMGSTPAAFLAFKYLEVVHQWSPAMVSLMVIFGGGLGILGNVFAGWLSDSLGRRTMAAVVTFIAPLLMLLFLHTGGVIMVMAWIGQLFCDTASTTLLNTFGAELFPTAQRSTATSTVTVAATLGAALGLWMESLLFVFTGSHWNAISLLTIAWIIAPFGVLLWFPETAGMELEAISAQQIG
jgi:MFS family permease